MHAEGKVTQPVPHIKCLHDAVYCHLSDISFFQWRAHCHCLSRIWIAYFLGRNWHMGWNCAHHPYNNNANWKKSNVICFSVICSLGYLTRCAIDSPACVAWRGLQAELKIIKSNNNSKINPGFLFAFVEVLKWINLIKKSLGSTLPGQF